MKVSEETNARTMPLTDEKNKNKIGTFSSEMQREKKTKKEKFQVKDVDIS